MTTNNISIFMILYIFLFGISILFIAIAATALGFDTIVGSAFGGIWFVFLFYSGYMYWRSTRFSIVTPEEEQQKFRGELSKLGQSIRSQPMVKPMVRRRKRRRRKSEV